MESSNNIPTAKISDAQRSCLSHILRDCEESIYGILTMVEDKYAVFSPYDIAQALQGTCTYLERILEAGKKGSFCAVPENECKFVSTFVGCSGKPDSPNKHKLTVLKE